MDLLELDRYAILELLPEEESMENMLLVKDIQQKVNFSEEERLKITAKENMLTFDKDNLKSIDLSGAELAFLKDLVSKQSENKKVSIKLLDSYLKIKSA